MFNAPANTTPRTITVGESILEKNEELAERNRALFASKRLLVLNVLSSPGSGKTAMLQRTIAELAGRLRVGVIVGDLETDNDARRLRGSGGQVVQITTGSICHLESSMVARAAAELDLDDLDILVIENVGNLVCPAAYDLGEDLRIVLLSTTEGEDKPLKYPTMFHTADAVVINKIDIAQAVGFVQGEAFWNIVQVAPRAAIFNISAKTGEGMDSWYAYLEDRLSRKRARLDAVPCAEAVG